MNYSLWNPGNLKIPKRSYLYSLRPQRLNTPHVESLTGYVARLAQAHNVFPGILMERELAPIINKAYGGANLHKLYQHTAALNGTGAMALNLVQALQNLTLHDSLQCLTMLPWASVLPTRGLLRSVRAWCPICYEEWQLNNQVLHDPLVWAIDVVRVCSLHQKPLITKCPHCQQLNRPLAWKSRPGYCSGCQGWLGSLHDKQLSNLFETEFEWFCWITNAVGELLAANSNLNFPPNKQRVAQALKFYVDRVTEGNIAELARRLQVPKNTLWLWYNGSNLPTLEALVRICYCLNTSPLNFLMGELQTLDQEQLSLPPSPRCKPRTAARVFDETYLQYLQQKLQGFLDSNATPLSMKEIAKYLGHDRRTIYRHFADLCHDISVKYDNYQKDRYLEAIEQACTEVHRVVVGLCAESIYPSEARVSERMNKPGYLRYKKVRDALREARAAAKS